jgi:hypothetical protein
MFRLRLTSRLSIRVGDVHLKASVSIGCSTSDRPRHREVARWKHLAGELQHYTSPSELLDLRAALDRYDDADTEDIREILNNQAQRMPTGP